ncbi:MAG: type I-U CRISPR-associated protein Csx17, partial [Verrucomicrobia bacterium]|nr:type I-U CRISPR-associated protein Csx17 [Verrucomicrobiota bacterium]
MSPPFNLPLAGCAPVPLAHYLKALGILRLVAEQADPTAAGCWQRDTFTLHSALDRDALLDFFLHRYQPTPILAPWNGGSGFYKKDNTEAIQAIEAGASSRMQHYRQTIAAARRAVAEANLKEKPSSELKESLLLACRNELPEPAVLWLDAAFVLTADGAKYPPLLGTGGNDGRLEFTNNFMQRLTEVMQPADGIPTAASAAWLAQSLFGEPVPTPRSKAPIGQFFPGAAGGVNGTSGFDADSAVNPWDYILMLEGALLFAAASVKRLEAGQAGVLAYPFCVKQAGVGYASAAGADEEGARAEMWLPLWERPATLLELAAVLGEGRAQVGKRAARNGVDFTRAVVTLGVDRGLSAFQRFGFQVRNGLAYFATPLERVAVRRNARADLLSEADRWMARLRDKAGPTAKQPPASVSRAL